MIEPEIRLLVSRTVAIVTGTSEDGLHVLHEIDLAVRHGRQLGEIGLGQFERCGVADDKPLGPGCARVDPGAEFADLLRLQGLGFLRRHRLIGVAAGDAMDQRGLGTFAIGEGRSVFTALAEMLGGVEPEPALLLARTVAGDAGVLEDRPDVALEIEAFRRGRKIGGLRRGEQEGQENPKEPASGSHDKRGFGPGHDRVMSRSGDVLDEGIPVW